MRTQQNQEGNTAQLRKNSEVRDGTSEDTLATPGGFSGGIRLWQRSSKRIVLTGLAPRIRR